MRNSGWAFHVHHDMLFGWCYNFTERVQFIKETKPESEQALRLKLFQLIPEKKLLKAPGKKVCADWRLVVYMAQADQQKILQDNTGTILKLHEKLCPNCPWTASE